MLHKQSSLVSYKERIRSSSLKGMWCKQLVVPNKKIFVKSGISKQKSMESQKDGKRGKITSFFVLKEHTEIGKFMLAF